MTIKIKNPSMTIEVKYPSLTIIIENSPMIIEIKKFIHDYRNKKFIHGYQNKKIPLRPLNFFLICDWRKRAWIGEKKIMSLNVRFIQSLKT